MTAAAPGRHDVDATLPWMAQGTKRVLGAVDALPDSALAEPSALPGWNRAHVVGHLARNAEALTRLASWARTGIENPMYTDRDQRAAEIERAGATSAATLRTELAATAEALRTALDALGTDDWAVTVRSATGRRIPAAEIPWMRIREVWLHAVDLRAGATVGDLPADVVDLLLDDVTATLSGKDRCPAVRLVASDRERTWELGTGQDRVTEVRGAAYELAGWVTGRTGGQQSDCHAPVLPRWL